MPLSKYVQDLCGVRGCRENGVVRYATPQKNIQNEEQIIYCASHWEKFKKNNKVNEDYIAFIRR